SCKKQTATINVKINNEIKYANGLEIHNYHGFTVMKVTKPWPNASKIYTYVLGKNKNVIPDSLKDYTYIKTPVKSLVATSTTHVSSIAILNEVEKLIGFPNLNYISSPKIRERIKNGFI